MQSETVTGYSQFERQQANVEVLPSDVPTRRSQRLDLAIPYLKL